jgi:DNA polymerase III epsilon subunit-like protein
MQRVVREAEAQGKNVISGDTLAQIMKRDGLSFNEAVKRIEKLGLDVRSNRESPKPNDFNMSEEEFEQEAIDIGGKRIFNNGRKSVRDFNIGDFYRDENGNLWRVWRKDLLDSQGLVTEKGAKGAKKPTNHRIWGELVDADGELSLNKDGDRVTDIQSGMPPRFGNDGKVEMWKEDNPSDLIEEDAPEAEPAATPAPVEAEEAQPVEAPAAPEAPVEPEVAPTPANYYEINTDAPYQPQGAVDGQESDDFTDDPAELSEKFSVKDLINALNEGVLGSENNPATGFGLLPFSDGDEAVPVEAIYAALDEKGVNAKAVLDDIYKSGNGNLGAQIPKATEIALGEELPEPALAEPIDRALPPLLEGLTDEEQQAFLESGDYKPYLPENKVYGEGEVPEGYSEIEEVPFNEIEGDVPENAPEGFSINPVDIANDYSNENLIAELRRALEPGNSTPGYGILAMETPEGEVFQLNVPVEAIRDALQLQGVDTNELIDAIYAEGLNGQGANGPTDAEIQDAIDGENVEEVDAAPEVVPEASDSEEASIIPAPPGSVPIPEGHVRLYHYSNEENIDAIKKDGLIAQEDGPAAQDGEPAMIWAHEDEPVGGPEQFRARPIVEFHVPLEQWNGGDGGEPGNAMQGPISPENIVAIHEPWHFMVRDILDNNSPSEILRIYPKLDNLGPDLDKAVKLAISEARKAIENPTPTPEEAPEVVPEAAGTVPSEWDGVPFNADQIQDNGDTNFFIQEPNPPSVMYHVAPKSAREDILKNGLDAKNETWNTGVGGDGDEVFRDEHLWSKDDNGDEFAYEYRPVGIYMFSDLEAAQRYAGEDKDIYEVNTESNNREIIRDPSNAANWDFLEEDEKAYVTRYVQPDSIKLLEAPEASAPQSQEAQDEQAGPTPANLTPVDREELTAEEKKQVDAAVQEPFLEKVPAKELQPGDIAVRDGEYFIIEEVDVPKVGTPDQKNKKANRVKVKGYYPGHKSQERGWFAEGEIEVIRGANLPAKGSASPIVKPELADYGKMKKQADGQWGVADPAAQEQYINDLAEYKAKVRAASAGFENPIKDQVDGNDVAQVEVAAAKPADGPFIVKARAEDLLPGDISRKDHFVIGRVFRDADTKAGFVSVEGYYPGYGMQRKEWKLDTTIEVVRGIPEADMPQQGEGSLHRPAGRGPKGGWFPDPDPVANQEHQRKLEEARARWQEPENLAVVDAEAATGGNKPELVELEQPKPPFLPGFPAFQGFFAEMAKQANGKWAEFKSLISKRAIIVFDFETTGVGAADGNEPYSVAYKVIFGGKQIASGGFFFNPGRSIKGTYAEKNGIDANGDPLTDKWLATQMSAQEAFAKLSDKFRELSIKYGDNKDEKPLLVAQNAKFDVEILNRKFGQFGIEFEAGGIADTMAMAEQFYKDLPADVRPKRKNLKAIAEWLDVKLENWHNADDDADATAQIFLKMLDLGEAENIGLAALDADARQAEYDDRMERVQPVIDQYQKDVADYWVNKAIRDAANGEQIDLDQLQKKASTPPVPEGPLDNGGPVADRDNPPAPVADIVDVTINTLFPDGKMRVAEAGWADQTENVEKVFRGEIKVEDLRPGDFVRVKKDSEEFWQVIAIKGGEEFGVEEFKRAVFVQNARGEQRRVYWRQNAFLDEVRRPRNRADLVPNESDPTPAELPKRPDNFTVPISVPLGRAEMKIEKRGTDKYFYSSAFYNEEGEEVFAVQGIISKKSVEEVEVEVRDRIRAFANAYAEEKRKEDLEAGVIDVIPERAPSISIGEEPVNSGEIPRVDLIDDLPFGTGENEITPKPEGEEVIFESNARVIDEDGDTQAQVIENFPTEVSASKGGKKSIQDAASEIARKIMERGAGLLRTPGRDRDNLPDIPEKYRRQVFIRLLAGLYADADGNPLAVGDKVVHTNPKMAAKYGEGVVISKVQGNIGGIQRNGVVYVDYVRVEYPDGRIRKFASRFQRHQDPELAKQRFNEEPRINWMNQDEMDIALAERRKKPRKGGDEEVAAEDAEILEVVENVKESTAEPVEIRPALFEAPETPAPETPAPEVEPTPEPTPVPTPEPEAPATGDPFVDLDDPDAILKKLKELLALFPKFRGKGEKSERWAGRELSRFITSYERGRGLDRISTWELNSYMSKMREGAIKTAVLPEIEKLLGNINLKRVELREKRGAAAREAFNKPLPDDIIPAVLTKASMLNALQEFLNRLPNQEADIDGGNFSDARYRVERLINELQDENVKEEDFDLLNLVDLESAVRYLRQGSLRPVGTALPDNAVRDVLANKLEELQKLAKQKAMQDKMNRNAALFARLEQPLPDIFPLDAATLDKAKVIEAVDGFLAILPTEDEYDSAERYLFAASRRLRRVRQALENAELDALDLYDLTSTEEDLRTLGTPRSIELADRLIELSRAIETSKDRIREKRLEAFNNRMAEPFGQDLIPSDNAAFDKDALEKALQALVDKLPQPNEREDVSRQMYRMADFANDALDKVKRIAAGEEDAALRAFNLESLAQIVRRGNDENTPESKAIADFAEKLSEALVAKQASLNAVARDAFVARRDVPLPADITLDETRESKEDFLKVIDELIQRLPIDKAEEPLNGPRAALSDLKEFRANILSASDPLIANKTMLTSAIAMLQGTDPKYIEFSLALENLSGFMSRRVIERPVPAFAGINLDKVDPIEVAETRVANKENLFQASPELQAIFADDKLYENEGYLKPFKDEIQAFFNGDENPLAQLDMRGRQAVAQKVAQILKEGPARTPELTNQVAVLAVALQNERDFYQPQRDGVGPAGNRMLQIDPKKFMEAARIINKTTEVVVDGVPTGFTARRIDSGINHANNYLITDINSGQRFILKKETNEETARAEYEAARVAAAFDISGRVYTELFTNYPEYMIQTFAGDTVRVEGEPRAWESVVGGINNSQINMLSLIKIAAMDAVISNTDRHSQNFFGAKGDAFGVESNGYEEVFLFPIDHGYAGVLNGGARGNADTAKSFFLSGSGRTVGELNNGLAKQIGGTAYKDLLDLTVQQAIQYFERVNDAEIRPEVLRVIISRLNDLRGIDTDELNRWAGKI